jgi:co-chaperonin GroES (HSP10)
MAKTLEEAAREIAAREMKPWERQARRDWEEENDKHYDNPSGLEPLGHAVLVAPYEPEFKKSIIEIPLTVRMRTQMAETRAIIVAIGPEAWKDEGRPRARIGDKVMITRFAGAMLTGPKDDKIYRMINDRDIYARISGDAWPETEQLEASDER